MKRAAFLLLAALPIAALADDVEAALSRGRAARADGVPEAAIHDLKRTVGQATAEKAPAVLVELTRCLLAADREAEAVQWLDRTPYRTEPSVIFWRAQARAQAGDYDSALDDYRQAGRDDAALRGEADFGSARMLEALGRSARALEVYGRISAPSPWHDAAELASSAILIAGQRYDEARRRLVALAPTNRRDREHRDYLLARITLETADAAAAERSFRGFEPRSRWFAAGAVIGEADALSRRNENEKAGERLEAFVRANPRSPLLGDLLAKFDEVRGRARESTNATLKQWEKDDQNAALSAAATYYLARSDERQGRDDRAIRTYAEFITQNPSRPLRVAAGIRLARMFLAKDRTKEAAAAIASAGEATLREDEAKLRFLRGATEHRSGNFSAATKSFVSAANLDPELSKDALANAALSAIDANSEPLAAEILNALRRQSPATARRVELAQAFQNAREGNPDAGEQLASLSEPGDRVGTQARLALSEWIWKGGDLAGARSEYLRVANAAAVGEGDQQDYFAVYLADDGSGQAAEAVAQTARDFLARHPDSPREADVRMKWGEVLMRAGDYRGARVQFEEAAGNTDDAERRQGALFLAARAAAGSMIPKEIETAISLLDEVATTKGGDLALQARWEQAKLQSALKRFQNAATIFDGVVQTTKDSRLRMAARLKKGDALWELGRDKPERAAEAIKEWRAVASAPDALPAERNEALTHAAAASEQAGDADAAVAAYYEVLSAPRDAQPEYFWYYKAGFAAAQLLIKRDRLKEAVAIYEKMAAVPGPLAHEAKEKVKRLRLENFIWEN